MALHRLKVENWDATRDFFPAQLCAIQMNRSRTQDTDRIYTADDFLRMRGYRIPEDAAGGVDLDRGAPGDWHVLKSNLRGKTEQAREQKKKRPKAFHPKR